MAGKRRHKRIIKRLDAQFSSEGSSFRATSSNLSASGLFLRTKKPLPPDTQVDVTIQLPDNTVARLRGTVRWALKSAQSSGRSGMGIEISENDRHYVNFLNTFLSPENQIIYEEQKKVVPAHPAAKTGQAATGESKPVPPPKSQPAATRGNRPVPQPKDSAASSRDSRPASHPKSPSAATQESDPVTDDNEIDSLILSLFSKQEKKPD